MHTLTLALRRAAERQSGRAGRRCRGWLSSRTGSLRGSIDAMRGCGGADGGVAAAAVVVVVVGGGGG
jgi:hypothetical protein